MPSNNPTQIVTGPVRLSYVNLFQPRANNEGDEPRFSCAILIPKSDKATLAKIDTAIKAAAEAGKQTKFGGSVPKNLKTTLRDGDEEADLDRNPEYAGHFYMNVSSKTKPGVVDRNAEPIMSAAEVYSGCYARVALGAFAYNTQGNRGVSFGLNHVMKWEDGEPLGNITRAEDVFAEYVGGEAESLI